MFLGIRSLIAKPNKQGSYTEKALSKPTLFYVEGEDIGEFKYYIVEKEEEMRPDLISEKFYGQAGFTDLICKYNNLYNPFSLEAGQLIKIPNVPQLYYRANGEPDQILDKGSISAPPNFVKKSAKDPKRIAYLSDLANKGNTAAQNTSELGAAALPPNFNRPDQQNIKTENGLIIFGGDITSAGISTTVTPVSRTNTVNKINSTS